MNKYLLEKNGELMMKPFNDCYIDDLLWVHKETNDEIANLIFRFQNSDENQFILDNKELLMVEQELKYDYHILIKALLNHLISYSNMPQKSKLINCCKLYIKYFFDNIDKINGGLPTYNMSVIIKWVLAKSSKYKKEISNMLFDKIIDGNVDVERYLSIADYFMQDSKLQNIFDSSQYEVIYNKYLIDSTDAINIHLYLVSYGRYYEYVLLNNKKIKNTYSKKYCDFVIRNITLIDNYTKQILLQKIRNIMDELKSYDDIQYSIIDENLEIANKAVLESLQSHTFALSQKQFDQINEYIKNQNEAFSKLSNVGKLNKLLFELHPLSIDEIKKYIESYKGTLSGLCEENIIDSDGKVINYKKLTDSEMFSLKANQYISFNINLLFVLLINPFFTSFAVDDEVIKYLKYIMTNNELISSERIELMTDYFSTLLNKDFKNSIYNIVEELEESLRFYFKSLKMNVLKRNGRNDLIGLSSIFNNNDNNQFRDKLLEMIDEDYYFTIKWFLVDPYGFGLRNKVAHRYKSKDLYNATYSIYISLMILRLHCGFQK